MKIKSAWVKTIAVATIVAGLCTKADGSRYSNVAWFGIYYVRFILDGLARYVSIQLIEDTVSELTIPAHLDYGGGWDVIGVSADHLQNLTSLETMGVTVDPGDHPLNSGFVGISDCPELNAVTVHEALRVGITDCPKLTSLTVYSATNINVTKCDALRTIHLGSGVTGEVLPMGTPNGLEEFRVDDGNPKWASDNGVLYSNEAGKTLWRCPPQKRAYSIPDGVTGIKKYAFRGCTALTSISMPSSVVYIGDYAFQDCKNLTSIAIPDGVVNVETGLCYNCYKLHSVSISDSVKRIREAAFRYCTGLVNLSFGKNLTHIERYAFDDCPKLADVWFKGPPPTMSQYWPSGVRGHYTAEYAEQWKAVIEADGTWRRMIMEGPGDYVVRLHGNEAVTTGGKGTLDVEFKFAEKKQLPACPFRVREWAGAQVGVTGQFMGWSVGTSLYEAETPHELWEDGKALYFTKEEATRWATRWEDGLPVVDLYAIWQSKVTVNLYNAGESVKELSPASLRDHVRWRLNTVGGERKSEESVLVPPGYQQLLLSVDDGYGSYVKDWDAVDTHGVPLEGNGYGDFQFEISSGEGPVERVLEVKLTADAEPGTVTFLCEGKMTDVQRSGLTGFPAFAWSKALIRVTRMGAGSAWPLEVDAQVPVQLPGGNYRAEYDYADMHWGAVPNIGYFSVTAGSAEEVPCTFMPYGSDHYYEGMAEEMDVTGETTESPVAVPYSWLLVKGASVLQAEAGDCEAAAMATAANGRAVWKCYVAGLDPADEGEEFKAELVSEDGKHKVEPVGGKKAGRVYRVEGKKELTDEEWEELTGAEDLETEGWLFFRLGVELAE